MGDEQDRNGFSAVWLISIQRNRVFCDGASASTIDAQEYVHGDSGHDVLFLIQNKGALASGTGGKGLDFQIGVHDSCSMLMVVACLFFADSASILAI